MARTDFRNARGLTLLECLIIVTVLVILALLIIPAIRRPRTEARKASCRGNLKQLGTSFITYNTTVGGNKEYPDGKGAEVLILLYRAGTLTGRSSDLYLCPTSGDTNHWDLGPASAAADLRGRQCSYAARDNTAYGKITDALDPGTVIASDDFEGSVNHSDGVNVLKFDWSVQWYDKRATGIHPQAPDPKSASKRVTRNYMLDTLAN
ncbi:MAG: hypothetical protein AAB215_03690 [Planctomycetota bacterium]|mgnify:CR=1 FL=1